MIIKSRLLGATCACFIISGFFSAAHAATWGAEAGVNTLSPCPSFCGGVGGMFEASIDGGEFSSTAYASVNNSDGNGQASASLSGPDLLPVLGAEGFSGPDSSASSYAVGMLGYTYAGATATTISLDIMLDGVAGGLSDLDPYDSAWVYSNVAVILGDVNDFQHDYPTFIFEVVPGNPGLSVLGESNLALDANDVPQTLTGSISFTLNPGDEFFVWAGLNAGGIRDGYGDAFSTLSMSFSDAAGITPNIIPVPAAVWLFGSGLIGLIGIARRKKA